MKKLIILLCALLPMGAMAQGVKIAYVKSQEVFAVMPELKNVETTMAKMEEDFKAELKLMEDEFTKKYTVYVSQRDTLAENIRLRRETEIQDIRTRMDNFVQVAQQDTQKKQMELIQPIQKKLQDAIKAVGTEKGYTYIVDPAALLFTGPDAVDATPFVKAKLGL